MNFHSVFFERRIVISSIKEQITEILADFLTEHNLELYDVKEIKEHGNNILQVLVDKENGINIDSLTIVNNYLSEALDNIDYRSDYYLEVSSPGAEKELRNEQEIKHAIDKYVFVKTSNIEYYGFLRIIGDEELTLEVNQKGRIRKININKNEISLIRLAIKF